MYKLRPREERGKTVTNWLNSFHTFSFAQYFDPFNMGFSDLRVINDDIIDPDGGFGLHSHANMEIITIVLDGDLEYQDNLGNSSLVRTGEVQVISAGSGITHSEFNPSPINPLHFLQIWILPNKKNTNPNCEQKRFSRSDMLNKLCLIVSDTSRANSIKIQQDVEIYQSLLEVDRSINFEIPENRKLWIHVTSGAVEINSHILEAGDGLAITNEIGQLEISGVEDESGFILFNLRNLTI